MVTKMYITAGLGPSAHNEGFTFDYDLPNQTAYAETCASVALIFWAQRMLHLDLDGKYARRPRACALQWRAQRTQPRRRALFLRQSAREQRLGRALGMAHLPVLHDECEPARRIGRWLLHLDRAGRPGLPSLWRHFRDTRRSPAPQVADPRDLELSLVRATSRSAIDPATPTAFDVKLRVPGWAKSLQPRGQWRGDHRPPRSTAMSPSAARGRRAIRIALDLPMAPERLYANPGVIMDVGRVALKRGPLVYCIEEARQSGRRGAAAEAAARGGAQIVHARRPVRRRRDHRRSGQGHRSAAISTNSIARRRPKKPTRRSPPCPIICGPTAGRGSMVVWIPGGSNLDATPFLCPLRRTRTLM